MEKKNYHHPDLRKKLLEATVLILREDGAKGLTIRKLASRAGVSAAAPYRHFSSKEEILAAITLEGNKRLKDALTAAREGCPGKSSEKLRALGKAYLDFSKRNSEYFRLMFSREGMSASTSLVAKNPNQDMSEYDSFGVLEEGVKDAQTAGELDPDIDSGVLSISIWSEIHGLATLRNEGVISTMSGQRGVSEKKAMELLLALFARHCGLKGTPSYR
jgi:AcrR family transcriptional regulator